MGAGSAGATAAIAVARSGAKVCLLERYGFLGGTSTAVLDTFYGFYTPGVIARKVVGGLGDEIIAELREFYKNGGRAMVDSMPCGGGRNVMKLAEVSRNTGVHIFCPTGLHLAKFYP